MLVLFHEAMLLLLILQALHVPLRIVQGLLDRENLALVS